MPFGLRLHTLSKILPINDPILHYPNLQNVYLAFQVSLGFVLSPEPIGRNLSIVYESRTQDESEQKYNTIDKELLSLMYQQILPSADFPSKKKTVIPLDGNLSTNSFIKKVN